MDLFTDEKAVSKLAPGCGSGDRHVENENEVTEVGVRIRIEGDDSVDTMVASRVVQWSVGQQRIQVASATVTGRRRWRRRRLRIRQVDVPSAAVDTLYLGALVLRREGAALAVDAEHVLVGGGRPAHLSRVGPS